MVQFWKVERVAMKLLEIKNNLVKLSYTETELPVLGRFIVLSSETKSYVAQFVNLKSDTVSNFAIAKLMFTFSNDGVVDNYDGSIPDINSELSLLPPSELLGLLPVETPLKIGTLAQQDDMLIIDASVFERNLTVFAEKDTNKADFISNCIRQLFQMREKSVIIDNANMFEDYEKIVFGKDFKLPLNSRMIDYLFEYELTEVDAATKAVIQDIFYAVQEYIRTLDFEFLPIDNFIDVVTNQYQETKMPELALLKNRLLKYRDSNIFANAKEEVFALKEKLENKNCSIIDIKDIPETLQNEVLGFVHGVLDSFDKYVYFFVPLTDDNSDKKLLKQFINHNHVFTTILTSPSYKYANELHQHAQNIILFAPNSVNHDFASYNTFLNKLNPDECIVCGKLTQGIPFIVLMTDLELDLTREDVLGGRYQFIPAVEDLMLVKTDENGNKIPVMMPVKEETAEQTPKADEETISAIPVIQQAPIEVIDAVPEQIGEEAEVSPDTDTSSEEPSGLPEPPELLTAEEAFPTSDIFDGMGVNPQERMAPGMLNVENINEEIIMPAGVNEQTTELPEDETEIVEPSPLIDEELPLEEPDFDSILSEDTPQAEDNINEFFNEEQPLSEETSQNERQSVPEYSEDTLTEDDLNFLEDSGLEQPQQFDADSAVDAMFDDAEEQNSYIEDVSQEEHPSVPVFPADETAEEEDIGFQQGDRVTHHRYGRGIVEKIIKYGNKTLCSISFENVGRRLLDPTITDLTKL